MHPRSSCRDAVGSFCLQPLQRRTADENDVPTDTTSPLGCSPRQSRERSGRSRSGRQTFRNAPLSMSWGLDLTIQMFNPGRLVVRCPSVENVRSLTALIGLFPPRFLHMSDRSHNSPTNGQALTATSPWLSDACRRECQRSRLPTTILRLRSCILTPTPTIGVNKKSTIDPGATNDPPAAPSNGPGLIHTPHADAPLGPVSLRSWKELRRRRPGRTLMQLDAVVMCDGRRSFVIDLRRRL